MSVKETIIRALHNYMGDDHIRAQSAFKNCTPAQMQAQYGQSGMTRQQILDQYMAHVDKVKIAIQWVESQQ